MPATRTHLPDLLLTALAPLIWGSTYLVTTLFLPPERPFTAALLGVLNIGLFQAMLFVAAYRLTGGLAAILTSTQTLMVLLLTWLVGGQMPPKAAWAWAWAAAGVAGIGLLVLSPTARLDGPGVAAALAGSAAMALGVYLSKHWQIKLSGAAFTGWQLVAGGLFLLPITLWREGVPHHLTAANAGGYAYLCLVGAVLAYGLFFRGLARLSPAAVSSLGLLSPVSAFVLGWLFLGQALDVRSMVGLVLALVSIAGIQRAMRLWAARRCVNLFQAAFCCLRINAKGSLKVDFLGRIIGFQAAYPCKPARKANAGADDGSLKT